MWDLKLHFIRTFPRTSDQFSYHIGQRIVNVQIALNFRGIRIVFSGSTTFLALIDGFNDLSSIDINNALRPHSYDFLQLLMLVFFAFFHPSFLRFPQPIFSPPVLLMISDFLVLLDKPSFRFSVKDRAGRGGTSSGDEKLGGGHATPLLGTWYIQHYDGWPAGRPFPEMALAVHVPKVGHFRS